MQVETFEITEIGTEGKIENFDQCKEIVDKLQLDGQQKFLNQDKKEVIPYRKMTAQESVVYSTICPSRTKLKAYADSMIPLRVLQIASHATDSGICDFIEVWHADNADIKDPVLIGVKGSEWSGERFILARWGEILLPFKELMAKAKELLTVHLKQELAEAQSKLTTAENQIDTIAEEAVLTGRKKTIYISIS